MKKRDYAVLVSCFRALPRRDRERLLWHAEQKTPVLCGKHAYSYIDCRGGG